MKRCSVCNKILPLVEFPLREKGKYRNQCKSCYASIRRQNRDTRNDWNANNPSKRREIQQRYKKRSAAVYRLFKEEHFVLHPEDRDLPYAKRVTRVYNAYKDRWALEGSKKL